MIEDDDATMIEGFIQKMDLKNGLVLVINSPGGIGLAAERIITICRNYSKTGEYEVIVPNKAKSAATMVCLGASLIHMGPSSELGPIDPQITIIENGVPKRFSVYNIVKSYDNLFRSAIRAKGRLEPYLQQLQHYDRREIEDFQDAIALSEDIAIRSLQTGMMKRLSKQQIKNKIEIFLTPKYTKSHGRPIYREEAKKCGLKIKDMCCEDDLWNIVYELFVRTDRLVSTRLSKNVETVDKSFSVNARSN